MDTQRIRVACDVEAVCEFNPTFGLAKQVRKQVHVTTVKGQKRPLPIIQLDPIHYTYSASIRGVKRPV